MDTDLKKTTPLVSVVMPVYNASSFIEESINSILQQTFSDFEFIIINDASTDNSRNIISSYTDSRIRIIDNEQNLGVTRSLNKGIKLARGKYIARMDADDIALSNRFEKQVAFLESNPDYGLVGAYMQLLPSGAVVRVPTTDEELKATMLFHNPFVHPAMMIRKSILVQHQLTYDESLSAAQDEDLWFRIAQYCKIANIPEVLL
ncbi:MAG TPA: glycosyltransferase, partial [Bacteroidales bacterium]|nr:glycosyltransferase [Bacteroidales bacterium]